MKLGYNTNGFGFHRLEDAIEIIADTGFEVVALTPDVHHLDPFRASAEEVADTARFLSKRGLTAIIETGARFVLNSRQKHRPTLLDDDPTMRVALIRRCLEIAEGLGAKIVSLWSGARPESGPSDDQLFQRLAANLDPLLNEAESRGLTLAIEPEPGFLVETMSDYDRLCAVLGRPIPLTLDIGHLQCVENEPPAALIRRYADQTVSIQLDDMVRGRHVHLPFGQGEVDFSAVFRALRETSFDGPACVELSDGSRNAVVMCEESMAFLRRFVR